MADPSVAIVGASGAVGREVVAILEQRGVPVGNLHLLASARSAGSSIDIGGRSLVVRELGEGAFDAIDMSLFCASSDVARRWAPVAIASGCAVVDNSSAFRLDPDTPLVVPEVNGEVLRELRGRPVVVANPNCSTIILVVALDPLRRAFGLRRAVVSTYQAVSGAGAAAMEELAGQTRAVLNGDEPTPEVFSEVCAFNVFSHDSAMSVETGLNVEEQKMIDESRKIWGDPDLQISPTCMRVPVMRAHTESICLTLDKPATEAQVRDVLARAPGVRVVDDRDRNDFPTALKAAGADEVLVGRIRPDATQAREQDRFYGFNLLVSGDQLRKGAALNAIQIAEVLLS